MAADNRGLVVARGTPDGEDNLFGLRAYINHACMRAQYTRTRIVVRD